MGRMATGGCVRNEGNRMFAELMAYCKTCCFRKDASDSHEAYDYLEEHLAENPTHDASVEPQPREEDAPQEWDEEDASLLSEATRDSILEEI